MAPRVVATRKGTFERDPPGCPDWRRFSIRSMHWSIRSPVFCQWPKWAERSSRLGVGFKVCIAAVSGSLETGSIASQPGLPRVVGGRSG